MTNFALLNNIDHQDVRIITERAARYGDNIMKALALTFEFRNLQAFYPILFQQSGDDFDPVALFGFQEHENLFLDEQGWQAGYIPAMVRREPFLIGFQESKTPDAPEKIRVLSLDMDHPRVNTEIGEPVFQPLGGRTTFVEDAADLLEAIYEGIDLNKAFVGAMREHDLLESVAMEIELKDGSRNTLIGFHCIDEEKVQELPAEVLGEFSQKGFLMPMFMALASIANIQRMVELKNSTLDSGTEDEPAH